MVVHWNFVYFYKEPSNSESNCRHCVLHICLWIVQAINVCKHGSINENRVFNDKAIPSLCGTLSKTCHADVLSYLSSTRVLVSRMLI